jgi:hypothetical protein
MKRIRHDTVKAGPTVSYAEYQRLTKWLSDAASYEIGSGRLPEEWQAAALLRQMQTRIRWLECELDEAKRAAARV